MQYYCSPISKNKKKEVTTYDGVGKLFEYSDNNIAINLGTAFLKV